MKAQMLAAVAAATAAFAPATAAVNLVQNGGFETTTTSSKNGNFEVDYDGGYGTVANWSVVSNGSAGSAYNILFRTAAPGSTTPDANMAETTTTAYSPSNSSSGAYTRFSPNVNNTGSNERLAAGYNMTSPTGGNFMALDGDSAVDGYLFQQIDGLTTGATYQLDFYWAASELATRHAPNGLTESLNVYFGYGSSFSQYSTKTVGIADQGFSGWMKETTTFTASNSSQILSFLSVGTPSGTPPLALLDGVSLTRVGPVPEPATWATMVGGFGAIGGAMRRRRRTAPAAA